MMRIESRERRCVNALVGALMTALIAATCSAADRPASRQRLMGVIDSWSCFRGPDRAGISLERGLPLEWSDSKNVVWKTELPGAGASSPVTLGDRIYVTCYSGYGLSRESPGKYEDLKRHVVCLSRKEGRTLWIDSFPNKVPSDHYHDFTNLHGFASSTPAVDETGVYVFFGTTGVRAYSLEGHLKWERSCGEKYTNFGSASSPVLFEDLVIVNASVEGQAVIALEKSSGREVWKAPTIGEARSTPLVVKTKDSCELVFHLKSVHDGSAHQGRLAAVDPRNGKSLWECQALDNYLNPSPVASDGIVYAIGNHPNRGVAIRAGGRGDVTGTHKAWEIEHGSEVCTPVYYKGHLYWTNEESGIAYCINASNGDVVYQERLQPRPGRIYASGVIGDGKLYYVSRENGTYALSAEPRFKLLSHNTIESDTSVFNATPAISRGQLLLRSDKYLYCVGEK